jgi:zinc transport system ATP-binding protein
MKILEVKDLNVTLGATLVLENINFEVEKGKVLAVIGPNGAGKSVLLKALLGLIPYRGTIDWMSGVGLGYVPQRMDIETDVPLTIREFFRLRAGVSGRSLSDEKLSKVLDYVQLDHSILDLGFGTISIGQRQRILVAWAVLGEPDVLLFDEPTADIDIAGQESIYNMLYHLQTDLGLTVILVSHDLNVVYRHAHRVICLNRKSLCTGAPRDVLNPEQLLNLYGGDKAFFEHKHPPPQGGV